MLILKVVLLTLHIAAAAMIFGPSLGTVGSLKRALSLGEPTAFKTAADDARRRGLLSQIGSIVTLLTGVALIFLVGGFGVVPPTIHAALTLMLVAIGLSWGVQKPAVGKLVAAAEASPPNKEAFTLGTKKLAMGTGISHLLWLLILVLMLVR